LSGDEAIFSFASSRITIEKIASSAHTQKFSLLAMTDAAMTVATITDATIIDATIIDATITDAAMSDLA
jgi:hypothetical protein